MTDPNFQRAEDLFHRARALSPLERAAFLDESCGGDLELRGEVESLLAGADRRSEDVLPRVDELPLTERGPLAEGPGTRLGHYKLLQQLGEGGFGTVYMAEQEEPVRRQVALKIIKLGMDTKQVIARFAAERQALALMDHPNIAKVLDAGVTDTGRPYFVMELVRGVEITRFCDENRLSPEKRLSLFVDVCAAVHHAHQKGVIHRDLKPSNVLVTLHDGVPVPKVIDFGIAKATSQRLTEKTLFTEFGQVIGTLEYMSPEQAELSGLDVDTRTDVYSLGVLLYELLTGSTPFDPRTLREATYDEIQRIIREVDPPQPSTRIGTAKEHLDELARKRGIDPQALGRRMRGDLDWIVMRALEKDRRRRYESARELARDVERHLANEAVEAGPPGLTYRFGKLVRRNRALFAAGTAVLAALVLGIVGTTLAMVRAAAERDRAQLAFAEAALARDEAVRQRSAAEESAQAAESQRRRAEEQRSLAEEQQRVAEEQRRLAELETERARAATSFLTDLLALADPQVGLTGSLEARELLDRASEHVAETLVDRPDMEVAVRTTLGRAYGTLGELESAREHLLRALTILDARADPGDEEVYAILWPLTSTLFSLGDARVNVVGRRMVYLAIRTVGREQPALAGTLGGLIESVGTGRFEAARQFDAQAKELATSLLEPGDTLWIRLADVQFIAGIMSYFLYDNPDAEHYFRGALETYRRELPDAHPQISVTIEFVVSALHDAGRYADAEPLTRESIAMREQVFPPGNWNVSEARALLAENLIGQGRLDEAEPLLLAAVENIHAARGLSQSMNSAGLLETLYRRSGRDAEAERWNDWLAEQFATVEPRPRPTVVQLALRAHCPETIDAWAEFSDLLEGRPDPELATAELDAFLAKASKELPLRAALAVYFGRDLWVHAHRPELPESLRASLRAAAGALLTPRGIDPETLGP